MKKESKGITLVALVVTIIILLILAGITINLTVGQRGILNRAQEAGKNYQEVAQKEDETLGKLSNEVENVVSGNLPENAIAKKVEIGDYVAYDPTAGVTDVNKLTYDSPEGTGSSHGNGYGKQSFTATNTIKWRVLSKDKQTGEVILISEEPIKTNENLEFYLKGGIGYLYAEQELNEICKIYGYGRGASREKVFEYETGDILDEIEEENGNVLKGMTKGTITGSGARSITVEDINKITKFDPTKYEYSNPDLYGNVEIIYKYGDVYEHDIFYPTKTSISGVSTSSKKRRDEFTSYIYQGLEYLNNNTLMYQMLFENNNYWLGSRCIYSYSNVADFYVRAMWNGSINHCIVIVVASSGTSIREHGLAVRPIVYLKSNIQTKGKDENGAWVISE